MRQLKVLFVRQNKHVYEDGNHDLHLVPTARMSCELIVSTFSVPLCMQEDAREMLTHTGD